MAVLGHLPGWLAQPEVQIAAICDPAAERRHHAFRILKGVRIYDNLDLMLDGERPDFVDIASPPAFHAAAARAALEADAHVLVEKPLCLSLDELESLIELARSRSRVLMCVHNWKHAPAYRKAFEIIESGRLGKLQEIKLERLRTAPAGDQGTGGRWRRDPALGGGILIDHGWHACYLAQWLTGGAAPRLVAARLAGEDGNGAEEIADLELTCAEGRRASIHLSWRAATRRTAASIRGERAILEIEGDAVRLIENHGARHDLPISDAPDDSYHAAWFSAVAREFQAAVEAGGGSIMMTNQSEARSTLAIISQARVAARS